MLIVNIVVVSNEFKNCDIDVDNPQQINKNKKSVHLKKKEQFYMSYLKRKKNTTQIKKTCRKEWLEDINFKLWLVEDKTNSENLK